MALLSADLRPVCRGTRGQIVTYGRALKTRVKGSVGRERNRNFRCGRQLTQSGKKWFRSPAFSSIAVADLRCPLSLHQEQYPNGNGEHGQHIVAMGEADVEEGRGEDAEENEPDGE